MNAQELEILIKLYINSPDTIIATDAEKGNLIGLIESTEFYTCWRITDKGKALVKEVLRWANLKLDFNPADPTITKIQPEGELLEELKDHEKSSSRVATEMGVSAKACGEAIDLTIETQGKKLEEIRRLKNRYHLSFIDMDIVTDYELNDYSVKPENVCYDKKYHTAVKIQTMRNLAALNKALQERKT
jgi:hypothetical protein